MTSKVPLYQLIVATDNGQNKIDNMKLLIQIKLDYTGEKRTWIIYMLNRMDINI